ncbi:MAG: hypothetical protein KBG28_17355 [Kofleriaceae bacterium]|nr:hypothetical protein [Kofleriaceae bacterium]
MDDAPLAPPAPPAAPAAAPAASAVASSSAVSTFLAAVRRRLLRLDGVRAALYALTGVLVVVLLAPIVAASVVHSAAGARAVSGVFALIAALALVAGAVVGLIVPRRRFGADAEVARWIGARAPALRSDLLSCVELAAAPGGPGRPSPALVAALQGQTERRLADVAVDRLVSSSPTRVAASCLLLALAGNGLAVVAAPATLRAGWAALIAPPTTTTEGATRSALPLVGDVELTLTFPRYVGRPPQVLSSSSGDLRALPGTEVAIRTRALGPVARATVLLEWTGASPPQRLEMIADGAELRARWTVTEAGRYRIRIDQPDGRALIEATPRQIELEVDQAPTVQLLAPADDLDVTNLRRIELAYVLEDDHQLGQAELVWQAGAETGRKAIPLATGEQPVGRTAQGKLLWDMAELPLPPGARLRYWLEARDTDDVVGPNLGRSREFTLRVWSPRERHEQNLARLAELSEKLLRQLGGRLPGPGDDATARAGLGADAQQLVVELGTQASAFADDTLADPKLAKALTEMRDRLDKASAAEAKLLDKVDGSRGPVRGLSARMAGSDARIVVELEDDVLALADWLERERLEGVLDIADEVAGHRKRLAELLDQLAKTGDPRLKEEIKRELAAIERGLADLGNRGGGLSEDVVDRFVHDDALAKAQQQDCFGEVRALVEAGRLPEAQAKLAECGRELDAATGSLENALGGLRGERFADEQRALDQMLDELADLSKDQDDVAAEADQLFDRYAEKADDLARANGRDARRRTSGLIERLRQRLGDVPEAGLTPFADEELDIVRRRVDDVERMIGDGDLAEAAAMARQARTSLDTIAGELDAALDDEPGSKFAGPTRDALDAVRRAPPLADELIDELDKLAPSPEQILSGAERAMLERLRRRQAMLGERAKKLAEKATQQGDQLPGTAGPELAGRLQSAQGRMSAAQDHMRRNDPGGARQDARAAAELLGKARDEAKGAARQQQRMQAGQDDPVRIPGADEYRAPEKFREDILEAMKQRAPQGFDDQVRRYYEELIK